MERLTDMGALKCAGGNDCRKTCADVEHGNCIHLEEALNKLSDYEDTGLTPDEIQEAVDLFKGSEDVPLELKKWVQRCTWHVKKCEELRKELEMQKAECQALKKKLDFVQAEKDEIQGNLSRLSKDNKFLEGQIEAYQYCMNCRR